MSPVRIRRETDIEWLRDVRSVAFPGITWADDDRDVWWVATRGPELLAFASARSHGGMLELVSCAVVSRAAGTGMQRRLIAVRERYAAREGCKSVCTYTSRDNYPSITNLIRAGYRFAPCRSPLYFNFVKYL